MKGSFSMRLHIISGDVSNLSAGEKRVLNKIKKLYEGIDRNCFLYIQPKIRNLEPDFILIDPFNGVSIIDVVDWPMSYIEGADRRNIKTRDGKSYVNPISRANQSHNLIKGIFESEDLLYNSDGDLRVKIFSKLIFTELSNQELKSSNFINAFNQPPSQYITQELIQGLTINNLFGNDYSKLNEGDLLILRSLLFPEIKIGEMVGENSDIDRVIKALDAQQEQFAKRLPYGHYMVSGVPGSGKTVILLTRALYLAKEHPDWRIRIVAYNRSISTKIENRLNSMAAEYKFMNINLGNITVTTFHKLALEVADIPVAQPSKDEWWHEILPNKALEKARPMFDVILIDEYQDFRDNWIELCIKLCIKHEYENSSKEKVQGINLFLAGDRLQSIYNPKEHSWKDFGIDMRGRSQLLKKTYRTGKEHINKALDLLMADPSLKKEVENFYEGRENIENETKIDNVLGFIEGQYDTINKILEQLIYKVGHKENEILILCRTFKSCNKLLDTLSPNLRNKALVTKDIIDNSMIITTYHSSKGLEAPVCILADVDKFSDRQVKSEDIKEKKLLYVGMTRASQKLYVHAQNYNIESFARKLKLNKF
jgi:superfamily I DNA/RNA helicase